MPRLPLFPFLGGWSRRGVPAVALPPHPGGHRSPGGSRWSLPGWSRITARGLRAEAPRVGRRERATVEEAEEAGCESTCDRWLWCPDRPCQGEGPQEVPPLAPRRDGTKAQSPGGRLGPAAVGSATRVPLGTHPAPGAGGAVPPPSRNPAGNTPLTSRGRLREPFPVPSPRCPGIPAPLPQPDRHTGRSAQARRAGGVEAAPGTAAPRDFGERRWGTGKRRLRGNRK